MKKTGKRLLACFVAVFAPLTVTAGQSTTMMAVISGEHRASENTSRDQYRHPVETLAFFEVRPSMTVVEVWPGGGWYTEILAPLLRQSGRYIAAGFVTNPELAPQWRIQLMQALEAKMAAAPDLYGKPLITELGLPDSWVAAPPGSADRVLTFRNVHNWLKGGYAEPMFEAFYAALKPGGILGVVEHRARPGTSIEAMKVSGYMTEEYVIKLATEAGFKLEARSEVNANPKDSADHAEGVWTLPPSLRLGEKDREKYLAIGESDRMTLKFVKPR